MGWLDKFRLAGTILYGSRVTDWKKLEQIPVRDWLIRLSGKRTFDRLWQPLLRAKLGDNYHNASAAFIWATIARLYAAQRTGLKKEMFGYVRGGYDVTIRRFAERLKSLGVQIQCGRPVSQIAERGNQLELRYPDDSTERFDKVVVTTSCQVANRLCADLDNTERERLAGIQYMGIVCGIGAVEGTLGRLLPDLSDRRMGAFYGRRRDDGHGQSDADGRSFAGLSAEVCRQPRSAADGQRQSD